MDDRSQPSQRRRCVREAEARLRRLADGAAVADRPHAGGFPLIRLAVRVGAEHAELVLAELLELVPAGVEEVALPDGSIEYAVYGAPGELPAMPALRAMAGDALVEVLADELPDDWDQRWRRFHRPLVLGERMSVRPPWESPLDTDIDLVIDPGRAFGTGAHATTRLCLELMLELQATGGFLDVGCGSGVLAIAASRLGFEPVLALDNDEAAIEATRANARRNGVRLHASRADLRSDPVPAARTVAANLLRPALLALAPRLPAGVHRLIASGLLSGESEAVAEAFAAHGLQEVDDRSSGEWCALLLARQVP